MSSELFLKVSQREEGVSFLVSPVAVLHLAVNMEQLQIYFRGHTDAVAYLKKIKAI